MQKYPYQLSQNDIININEMRYVVAGVQMKGMMCKVHVIDAKPLILHTMRQIEVIKKETTHV